MKKTIAIFILISLCFVLGSCKNQTGVTDSNGNPVTVTLTQYGPDMSKEEYKEITRRIAFLSDDFKEAITEYTNDTKGVVFEGLPESKFFFLTTYKEASDAMKKLSKDKSDKLIGSEWFEKYVLLVYYSKNSSWMNDYTAAYDKETRVLTLTASPVIEDAGFTLPMVESYSVSFIPVERSILPEKIENITVKFGTAE